MIKLHQLTMKGFRSFKDANTITFPESGLLLLQGKNGSGKSTIGLAIAYALGYCPFPASALKSWTGTPMQVSLSLDTPKGRVEIWRGEKTKVVTPEGTVQGSVAAVDAKIQEIIGLDSTILGELCYRPQQTRGTFVSKTDKEKKEFLCCLLKLDLFERAAEKAKEGLGWHKLTYDRHVSDAEYAERHLEQFRKEPQRDLSIPVKLAELESQLTTLAKQEAECNEKILKINKQQEELKAELAGQTDAIKAKVEEYEKSLVPTPYDTTNLDLLAALIKKVRKKLDALEEENNKKMIAHFRKQEEITRERNRVLATIASIDDELNFKRPKIVADLESLRSSKCPTCEQDWVQAQDHMLQAEMMISAIDKRAQSLPDLLKVLPELEKNPEPFTPDPEASRFATALQESQFRWSQEEGMRKAHEASEQTGRKLLVAQYRQELEGQLDEVRGRLAAIDESTPYRELSQIAAQKLTTSKGIDNLRLLEWSESRDMSDWAQERAVAEEDAKKKRAKANSSALLIAQEEDFLALVGREGFLGAIFDEVLCEISDETNRVLSALPNTADVFLEFVSENTTAKGTVSREIKPVITIRGHTAPLKAGCSGGMLLSVEQAVDIAINRVVSRRTGVVPGWIVMDECFADMDVNTQEEMVAVLRELSKERVVVVVDHHESFKEMFSQNITLSIEKGISSIAKNDRSSW